MEQTTASTETTQNSNPDTSQPTAATEPPVRSEYLGVYNIPADKQEDGKAFRVAIKLRDRETGSFRWFNVRDNFASEAAAARIYNAYAINFFGKGAILNAIPEADALDTFEAVNAYFTAKPNRVATFEKIKAKTQKLRDAGVVFKTHLDLDHGGK